MKTLNLLAKEISKREGKKKQVDIAQIKEILGVLCDIFYEEPHDGFFTHYTNMLNCGFKRANKKIK